MSIKTGLERTFFNQKKNSTLSRRYRLTNGTLKCFLSQVPIYCDATLSLFTVSLPNLFTVSLSNLSKGQGGKH